MGVTPEERALESAYARVAAGRTLLMMAAVTAALLLGAADFALATAALWVVPRWPAVLLAAFLCEEAARLVLVHGLIEAQIRQRGRGLTRQQRTAVAMARVRTGKAPLPWWLAGPRSRRFWAGVAGRAVFAGAEFAVLSHWLGHPLGFALTACLAVFTLGVRSGMLEAAVRWQRVAAFTAPPEA